MRITKKKEIELAQKFFRHIWSHIEDGDDYIYEEIDPECEFGEELCKVLNFDVVLEVIKIGFKAKYGEEFRCGVSCDGGAEA